MHLTLHLTGSCNLRCHYCYDQPHRGGDMSIETIHTAINLAITHLKKDYPGGSLGINFFGGEPLLKRDLIKETMGYCHSITQTTGQHFHFRMTTNGTLLDESFLTDNDTRDVYIALSHDGIQAAHDAHRLDSQGNGTHQRLETIIKLILQYKPYAPAMTVINPDTVQYYTETVHYLYSRGFRYIMCTPNYSAVWKKVHLKELIRQYNSLAKWYYRSTLAEEKLYFSPFDTKIASHIHPGNCKTDRCMLARHQISIAPNGRIYPCIQFVGDGSDDHYCIGHVQSGIDETTRTQLYAINEKEKEACVSCAIRERCNHYCACINKNSTGHVDQIAPALCAHERIVLPIADRLATRLYKKRSAMFIQKHYNDLYPLISLVEDNPKTTM